MKTKTTLLIMFAIIISIVANSQVLDQSQLNYNGGTSARTLPGYSHFQSFTAGITGTLVEIDMGVFNFINGAGTLKIYEGADTTGALLQTTPVTINCPSGACFTNFTTSVPVTSGLMYCFRFIPGAGIPDPYGVQIESPGTYAGGQFELIDPSGVSTTGFDQVFRTYVIPSSVGMATVETVYPLASVYPNPFSSSATIYFRDVKNNAAINIYNFLGQKIKTIFPISGDKVKVERDNLSNGIYFFQLVQDDKVITTDKFVIAD